MEAIALTAQPTWRPETPLPDDPRNFWTPAYGLTTYGDLFTPRQLVALTTFSDLVQEARERVKADALAAGRGNVGVALCEGGSGAGAYSEAISIYLACGNSRSADFWSNLCIWANQPKNELVTHLFGRQAIPMAWDFAEANPFSDSGGNYTKNLSYVTMGIEYLPEVPINGEAQQEDAASGKTLTGKIISTDPPYYDNIAYADLSEYFYVWLRRTLYSIYPALFATLAVPKAEELVATPYRHGGKENAEKFFLDGMTRAMSRIAHQTHPAFPVTIYYAFRQKEKKGDLANATSTGWQTFLDATIRAGFSISGTWPMRTERQGRMIGNNTNALASSVVLVCHRRPESAITLSRTDFRRQLRHELPHALNELERANIAPVDVAQAAIGPGMAIYSSAKAVLNPDDSPMSVREALIEINTALDEYLSQDEGEIDTDSRFALTFFESFGYKERDFGDAEGLAKARNLSVAGVAEAGILRSVAGKVRLLQRAELEEDWDPTSDKRLCVWEATQQLIKRLEADGEDKAADLLLQLKMVSGHGDLAANCRALAYRLYNHCEKTKQAEEARAYNGLVIAWPELEKRAAAASTAAAGPQQLSMV
jgi:putative DNA methylase